MVGFVFKRTKVITGKGKKTLINNSSLFSTMFSKAYLLRFYRILPGHGANSSLFCSASNIKPF